MITIRHLDKTFNRGKQNAIHVINDVTLDLPASGMVAIFGRSGCGKTTLLNVIGGLDRVQGGQVEIDGERMTLSSDALRNRSVGYIFQNYCLNREKTCRENVADALRLLGVSDRTQIDAQVEAALRAVGMERFASRLPDTLSGGQQQRIAIARAIVKNPPVILADEPTGNLDEQNTLHVMRLLKAISRDRLVLLVTHEENLVQAFSDRVIELSDGRVVSDRKNVPTEGFTVRDKNAIYLGELSQKTLLDGGDGVSLDVYGETPAPEVKLRLVRAKDGRVYLKIDGGKVNVLDESSEIRLEEGVAPDAASGSEPDDLPDLSAIKPVRGARPGRLFGFADAWKSGVRANLGKRKRGRKVLRGALVLFAAVVVFMTASLGVFVRKLIDVDGAYHHGIVYAYAGDEISAAALAAIGEEEGVDYRQIILNRPSSDRAFSFSLGNFETFSGGGGYLLRGGASITASGVALLRSAASSRKLIAGKNTGLGDGDALISEGMAKALLKESTVDYLRAPGDLIGVLSEDGDYRIAGVVEGNDRELFLSVTRLLSYRSFSETTVYLSSAFKEIDPPAEGKVSVILPSSAADPTSLPAAGDSVLINGKSFTVDRVIRGFGQSYAEWCEERGYDLPALTDDPGFALSEEYLAHYPEYLNEKATVFDNPDVATALWRSGRDKTAYYWCRPFDGTVRPALVSLAYRLLWCEEHPGKDPNPTEAEVREWATSMGDPEMSVLYAQRNERYLYSAYTESYPGNKSFYLYANGYLMNEKDAEEAYARVGKTTVLGGYREFYEYNDSLEYTAPDVLNATADVHPRSAYVAFRTSDPEKTVAAIRAALGEHYADLEREKGDFIDDWAAPLYTPADFRREAMTEQRASIVSNAIELAVFLAVMSLCMYLIMRASTMGRIREIGIYRAIGVSKKNLVFRFFVESLAVTSLTVLVGYLFSTFLISAWLVKVPLLGNYFYYPVWMALSTLALLFGIGALCGTLPVLSLLRRTPSEILSKYDI